MRDEYDHDPEAEHFRGFPLDAAVPVMVLSLSLIILLGWQASTFSTQRKMLQDTAAQQEQSLQQAAQVEASVKKLASDLLEAAQTDAEAKELVAKYGIQRNQAVPPGL